jgi:hypothetical protein
MSIVLLRIQIQRGQDFSLRKLACYVPSVLDAETERFKVYVDLLKNDIKNNMLQVKSCSK